MFYILCDIEATGNRTQDKIIQLGLVILEESLDNRSFEIYGDLNHSSVPMMPEAMEIHHITPDMIEDRVELQNTDGYRRLSALNSEQNIFISHDAPSDLKYLKRDGFENSMRIIDTLKCAKHLYGQLDAHRLQYLRYKLELYKYEPIESQHYSIDIKAHSAIGDAVVMKILLSKLITDTKIEFNLSSQQDVTEKLIELSSTPILIKKFSFGKYKGEYIDEIVHSDYKYIEWMRDTLKLDEDMKYTLDYYLY